MKTVRVDKKELRETLLKNRDTHKADFAIAWDAFQAKTEKNLKELLKHIRSVHRGDPVNLYLDLAIPQDHTSDYDRALEMLNWEIQDQVQLTEGEFQQLVQDDWVWKEQFSTTNTFYTGSASPSKVG